MWNINTIICNTINKNDSKSVYLLFSRNSNRRWREFKRTISKITLKKNICRGQEAVLHLQRISDSNAYNCGSFAWCAKKEQGANCFTEWMHFLEDRVSWNCNKTLHENRSWSSWHFRRWYILQWNLYKADTIRSKKSIHFMEMSAL